MEKSKKEKQLRPGLWATVNETCPGSMITKNDFVPLAKLSKPLSEARLTFVSTAGEPHGTLPFDTAHPVGDYAFRRVPSDSKVSDLEIHQLKYPTFGAEKDLNVVFPVERLQELAAEKFIGELAPHFFSFIGYNMDAARLGSKILLPKTSPKRWRRKIPMSRCCRRRDRSAIRASRWFSVPLKKEEFRLFRFRSRWMSPNTLNRRAPFSCRL